ncbi:MAG: alanine racemase [Thermoanaerobaculaceae bacterium]|nr:alanine racemase [Thermoanaerobaculaceae bacterium]
MANEPFPGLTTWIEVSRGALAHNLSLFRGLLAPGTGLLAVVKANAYGHGIAEVAGVCAEQGVDMLGVHTADEVAALAKAGIGLPVLLMGYVTPAQVEDVVRPGVHVLASSATVVEALAAHARRLGTPIPVHVKVDTGTHRQGVEPEDAGEFAAAARDSGLAVVGVATHFANIEDTTDHAYAFAQLERFRGAVAAVEGRVGRVPWVHAACSAAALLFREADFTMVRIGISLYGHWPSKETHLSWLLAHGRDGVKLEPALAWRARVGQVKRVAAGAPIGYGLTYRPTRPSTIAVLPVGYADGYPRALSNRARVILRGRPAPVVGRVCMDILMADVTDVPGAGEGDVATLIGADGGERVSAEELADLAGTINYEILARLSPALARSLVE